VNKRNRFSFWLAIAGCLALGLIGCGKETPGALIESANSFATKGDYKAAAIQLRNALQQKPDNGEARYLLGRVLNEEMDYITAESELRKALEYGYTRDATYAALGQALLRQGKNKELVVELKDRKLADREAEASVETDLGLAYFGLGQRDEARRAFDTALNAKPGYDRARIGQAILVASDRDLAGAMKIVDDVLATAPELPEALNLKADLLIAQNDLEGAIKLVEQAVKVQPNNFRARYALTSLRIKTRKFDQAAADVAAMKKALPRDVNVAYLEALLAFGQGDAAKTREAAQQALKVAPDHAPSLLLAAAADSQLRSFDSAVQNLRLLLDKYPQSTDAQMLLIKTYLQSGQPEKAWTLLAPALRRAPDDPKLLELAGATALATNDLARASQYYERAATLDKEAALPRTKLAQVRIATGDVDRAMKDLESASQLDATGYEADLALITQLLRRKEFDKALAAANRLEKKQPNNPLTYNVKGVVYVTMRDSKNARASFAKALELQFDYLPAAQHLAWLDIAEKNPTAARGRLEAIIAKEPKNEEALVALADIQAATGNSAKDVVSTLARAVAANPASVNPKIALANRHLRDGDAKAALAVAQSAAASNPGDAKVLEVLGAAQQAAGDTNQAIATFQKLVALQPKATEPLVRLAMTHYAAKDYDAAIQTLRKALALKPDSVDMRREIVRVAIAAGKTDDALAVARAVEKEQPKASIGFVLEGDAYAAQNKWDLAGNAFREAVKREKTPLTLTRLHAALQNQGKAAEASTLAEAWIRENPNDVLVRLYLAGQAAQDQSFKEAARLYKDVLALQPDNVLVLNNLAWVGMEIKDAGAFGYAEKAYALAPENASVLDTYGWLLLQKGEAKRAVELLTAALRKAPGNPIMRLHLAKALIQASDKTAARKEIEALLQLDAGADQRAEAQALLKGL